MQRITALILIVIFVCSMNIGRALAKESVDLYFFYNNDCPVCARAKTFLADLARDHPSLKLRSFEVFYNLENRGVYLALGEAYNLDLTDIIVPVIFIGEKSFTTYNSTVAAEIRQTVIRCLSQKCPSPIEKLESKISGETSQINYNKKIIWAAIAFLIILAFFFLKTFIKKPRNDERRV